MAFCGRAEEFDRVCEMSAPLLADAPVMDAGALTVQANVVDGTCEVSAICNAVPEQIVSSPGLATASGCGFTFILIVSAAPGQVVPLTTLANATYLIVRIESVLLISVWTGI